MTRVHAADGSLVAEYARERRLYIPIQAVPKLVINAFLAAEDKNFYEHGGLDFTGIARAAFSYIAELRQRPPPAGRLDHHPAGRQELPADQRGFARAQDQGGAARAQDRAHLLKDKILELYSTKSISALAPTASPPRRSSISTSRCNELTVAGSGLSRRAAEGAEQLQSVPRSASARSSGATGCIDQMVAGRLHQGRRRREGEEASRSTSRSGRPARTSSPPNISPRRCAANSTSGTARRSSTKAACRCAPRSIPSCRCWRARR